MILSHLSLSRGCAKTPLHYRATPCREPYTGGARFGHPPQLCCAATVTSSALNDPMSMFSMLHGISSTWPFNHPTTDVNSRRPRTLQVSESCVLRRHSRSGHLSLSGTLPIGASRSPLRLGFFFVIFSSHLAHLQRASGRRAPPEGYRVARDLVRPSLWPAQYDWPI